MNWKNVNEQPPFAMESGNWDGLRTDWLLVCTRKSEYHVAKAYVGTMDGCEFCTFEDNEGWLVEGVTHYTTINPPY